MRIWQASMGLGMGGAERVVIALADGFAARGHELGVSGRAGPLDAELGPLALGRVVLEDRGRSPAGAARDVLRLARALRRARPHVVHAHNVRVTAVAGAAARLAGGPRRAPVVATFHGVDAAEYRAAARLLRAADLVACVSADLAGGLREHGFPAERLAVVANAAPEPVRLAPEQHRALADELRGPGGGPLVVAVGRLVAQKNHARLLEAFAAAGREDARLAIVGDGPLREQLEARAGALGLAGRVRFTGLRLDARAIVAHADLLAFSSDWEGLSIAALEALAAGTPVVSTPVQGMAELLSGGAGLVVGSASAAELGAGIRALLGDPERREAMARAGRELATGRYSPAAMLDAYLALYARVSGRG